jgi:hypothetical protein
MVTKRLIFHRPMQQYGASADARWPERVLDGKK